MKLFPACLIAVVLSLAIFIPYIHAGDNEIVIRPDDWKAASEPASPGGKFRHVGGGGGGAKQKEAAPDGPSYPVNTSDSGYYSEVVQSSLPVVLEFWSPGCGHCRKMAPVMDDLASELAGKVKVVKMNVDDNSGTPEKYRVNGIPAFFYVKHGNVVSSTVGSMSKSQLKRELGL